MSLQRRKITPFWCYDFRVGWPFLVDEEHQFTFGRMLYSSKAHVYVSMDSYTTNRELWPSWVRRAVENDEDAHDLADTCRCALH